MQLKSILVAATLLLSISSVQANMVFTDWDTEGDAKSTLDTDTGLEWLRVTETNGMSMDQVTAKLGTTFAGWRLPTASEVQTYLVNMIGVPYTRYGSTYVYSPLEGSQYNRQFSDNYNSPWRQYANAFDNHIGVWDRSGYNYGFYINDDGLQVQAGSNRYSSGVNIRFNYRFSNFTSDYQHGDHGVFLVSDGGTTLSSQQDPSINANNAAAPINNVSAPALLGLMGLGLFGFAARRRSLK
jgi:hypothetical protein